MKKKRGFYGHGSWMYLIFRKMKLSVFFVLCSMLGSWASQSYSQTTGLTLKVNNMRIEEFLKLIEDQSSYRFFYSGKIDVERRISGSFEDKAINGILDEIFEGSGIRYELKGRQVILSASAVTNEGQQQSRTVSGKVTDVSGSGIPGVSVAEKMS